MSPKRSPRTKVEPLAQDQPQPELVEEIAAPAGAAEPSQMEPEPAESAPVIDAVPVAAQGGEQEAPDLEPGGDLDEASAQVLDTQLETLLRTPLGLRGGLEAILFASPEPLGLRRICNLVGISDSKLVAAALEQLAIEYDGERRGLVVQEVAGGYQMVSRELYGDLILRLKGRKRRSGLSQAALETLAIVAYRQPLIRAEIESVRGVESGGTLRNLIDMGLVEMVGRKDVLGRPPMYGTSQEFLTVFGLRSLNDLPPIAELKRRFEQAAEQEEEESAPPPAEPAGEAQPGPVPEPDPSQPTEEAMNPHEDENASLQDGQEDFEAKKDPSDEEGDEDLEDEDWDEDLDDEESEDDEDDQWDEDDEDLDDEDDDEEDEDDDDDEDDELDDEDLDDENDDPDQR